LQREKEQEKGGESGVVVGMGMGSTRTSKSTENSDICVRPLNNGCHVIQRQGSRMFPFSFF